MRKDNQTREKMKKEHHIEEHHTIYMEERYIESGTVGG